MNRAAPSSSEDTHTHPIDQRREGEMYRPSDRTTATGRARLLPADVTALASRGRLPAFQPAAKSRFARHHCADRPSITTY